MHPRSPSKELAARARLPGLLCLLAFAGCTPLPFDIVQLPEGERGIGFDDLRYSASLGRMLVPAGRSGRLDLIEPDTLKTSSISGFTSQVSYSGGHDDGATSVEEAGGTLYVTDRSARTLFAVDPGSRSILGSAALGAEPDYVRFVASTNELWVTEPSAAQIEIFGLDEQGIPVSTGATFTSLTTIVKLCVEARLGLPLSNTRTVTT